MRLRLLAFVLLSSACSSPTNDSTTPPVLEVPDCSGEDEIVFAYRSHAIGAGSERLFYQVNGISGFYLTGSCDYYFINGSTESLRDSGRLYGLSWDSVRTGTLTAEQVSALYDNLYLEEFSKKYSGDYIRRYYHLFVYEIRNGSYEVNMNDEFVEGLDSEDVAKKLISNIESAPEYQNHEYKGDYWMKVVSASEVEVDGWLKYNDVPVFEVSIDDFDLENIAISHRENLEYDVEYGQVLVTGNSTGFILNIREEIVNNNAPHRADFVYVHQNGLYYRLTHRIALPFEGSMGTVDHIFYNEKYDKQ